MGTVVNIRTSPYDVLIDRTSIYGNPFRIGIDGDRKEVIRKYRMSFRELVESDPAFKAAVLRLRGKVLG